jgi:hypothetical protein
LETSSVAGKFSNILYFVATNYHIFRYQELQSLVNATGLDSKIRLPEFLQVNVFNWVEHAAIWAVIVSQNK